MPTPDQMDMFDLLYALAAADGRDEALLGGRREQLRSLYERTLIGSARPSLYLEFPLLGEPCYDFLAVCQGDGSLDTEQLWDGSICMCQGDGSLDTEQLWDGSICR